MQRLGKFVSVMAFLCGLVPVHNLMANELREKNAAVSIIAFGDSLTAGYHLDRRASLPVQLQEKLQAAGIPVSVKNAGKSGDTSYDGLRRLRDALNVRANLVILEFGTNDALRGVAPQVTRANLVQLIRGIKETHSQILLIGTLAPSHWGPSYKVAFDAIFPDLAREYQIPLYPFILAGVVNNPKLTLPDGLHPNREGVAAILENLAPAILEIISVD